MIKKSKTAISVSVIFIMLMAMATTVFAAGELKPNMAVDVPTAAPGDTVKFTVTLQGTGTGLQGDVVVSSNLQYVGNTDDAVCSEGTVFTIAPAVTYEYKVRADAVAGPYSFKLINMKTSDLSDPEHAVTVVLDGESDEVGGTVTPAPAPLTDAEELAADKASIEAGVYVIPVANQASDATKLAWVQATVNTRLIHGSAADVTYSGGTYTVELVNGGANETFNITVTEAPGPGGPGPAPGPAPTPTSEPAPAPATTPTSPQTGVYA